MQEKILNKIKKLRREFGFTQVQLAQKLNIETSTYQKMESGENHTWLKYLPDILMIYKIEISNFFKDIDAGNCITQNDNTFSDNAIQYAENIQYYNKEIISEMISTKNELIRELKESKEILMQNNRQKDEIIASKDIQLQDYIQKIKLLKNEIN